VFSSASTRTFRGLLAGVKEPSRIPNHRPTAESKQCLPTPVMITLATITTTAIAVAASKVVPATVTVVEVSFSQRPQ
jgi:hypothetical protein